MKKLILILTIALFSLVSYSQWDKTSITTIDYATITADTMLFYPISGGSGVTVALKNISLSDSIGFSWGWSTEGYDFMEQILPSGLTFPQYLNPADSILVNGSRPVTTNRNRATYQYATAKGQYISTVVAPWLVVKIDYTSGITGLFNVCVFSKPQ